MSRPRRLLRAFVLTLIALLAAGALLGLFLLLDPGALQDFILSQPLPGVVRFPDPGATPPPPTIQAATGQVPAGELAFRGAYAGGEISCVFLLDLAGGVWVGVSAAHATPALPPGVPAALLDANGATAAALSGLVGRGRPFVQEQFTLDYALWAVDPGADPHLFLQPDERGTAQPGERVWLLEQSGQRRAGVVLSTADTSIWIQMDDSFDPRGLSGCPVVSQHTGRVVGMAVAGMDRPPVIIGLHPVGSLIEKARYAFSQK